MFTRNQDKPLSLCSSLPRPNITAPLTSSSSDLPNSKAPVFSQESHSVLGTNTSLGPSVVPFILRRYNGSRHPISAVPDLRELSQQRPRSSSGGTASHFIKRLIQQVHQLLPVASCPGLPQSPWGPAPLSAPSGTPLTPYISRPFARHHTQAAGPYHRHHHRYWLSIHASTLFPPASSKLAHRQPGRCSSQGRRLETRRTNRTVPPSQAREPGGARKKTPLGTRR